MAAKTATKKRGQTGRNQTKSLDSANPVTQLVIRYPHPDELFYRTGNGTLRHCLRVDEIADGKTTFSRFREVINLHFSVLSACAMPTVFHEVISTSGECFAFPQVLSDRESPEGSWAATVNEVFSHCFGVWMGIYSEDDQFYSCQGDPLEETEFQRNPTFQQQLDATLLTDCIEGADDPVVQRLDWLMGWTPDMESQPIYVNKS